MQGSSGSFARTGHAMRAMEAVALAAAQREPVLLVGETGTGKTTLVQQIAQQVRTRGSCGCFGLLVALQVPCMWAQPL